MQSQKPGKQKEEEEEEEEDDISFPSSASALTHTQLFHRLCTGTRIWALINRIISYGFLLPLSLGWVLRAVGLTSLP